MTHYKQWISDYVAAARSCRRFGRKDDAERFMRRARGLRDFIAVRLACVNQNHAIQEELKHE